VSQNLVVVIVRQAKELTGEILVLAKAIRKWGWPIMHSFGLPDGIRGELVEHDFKPESKKRKRAAKGGAR
jgi:hypothetical protein